MGLDFACPGKRDNYSKTKDVQMTFKFACCSSCFMSVITLSHYSILTNSFLNGVGTSAHPGWCKWKEGGLRRKRDLDSSAGVRVSWSYDYSHVT